MLLSDHATNDTVRSLLGVTVREIKDVVLDLPHWMTTTELELRGLDNASGAALAQFETIKAIASGSRTAAQAYYYKVFNQWVLYSVGRQLTNQAEMFSPNNVTDGHASVGRNPERWERLKPAIEGGYQMLAARLKEALLALVPNASVPTGVNRVMIVGAALGTDPVTGV